MLQVERSVPNGEGSENSRSEPVGEVKFAFSLDKDVIESFRWYPQGPDGEADLNGTAIDFSEIRQAFQNDQFVVYGWGFDDQDKACSQTVNGPVMSVEDVCYVGVPLEHDEVGLTEVEPLGL